MLCRKYIAVDVETTGLSPRRGHRVIEIGAVAIENGWLGHSFHRLINAGVRIPASATHVHGITTDMLNNAPPPKIAFEEFRQFLGNATLVAHNAAFDISFIKSEMARMGPPCVRIVVTD